MCVNRPILGLSKPKLVPVSQVEDLLLRLFRFNLGQVKMEDITMEEYIQLESEKALKRSHMFNWETAMYDASTSKPEVSSKPTVSPDQAKEVDFDFEISFTESDDEDYTFMYDKNSFSYKLIFVNDLKSNSGNDDDKINIKLSSKDVPIEPLDDVIVTNVDTYSDENFETNHDIADFRDKIKLIRTFRIMRLGWANRLIDNCYEEKDVLGELMDREKFSTNLKKLLIEKPRMRYQIEASTNTHDSAILDVDLGASVSVMRYSTFTNLGLGELAPTKLIIVLADRTITLQEPLRRLCHRLITFSINGRGQAPKKVTTTDLYYFRSMDEGTRVNIPYLLALCLFRFGKGRKQGARMSRGHFITRLGVYFRVITKEILKALTVVVRDLTIIDMVELVRLQICERLLDVPTWVALGPERQQAGAVVGAAEVDPKVAQEGVQGDPTPAEAASMPQAAALHLGLCRRGC
ncbi:hypothetical protein Tco_0933039 [Tanacetum coccineum]